MIDLSTFRCTTFESPYAAGYDCGKHGPTEQNCHFTWFSSTANTAAWECGKRHGEGKTAASEGESL